MPDYEFDVFVSYRRHGYWPSWVRGILVPLLNHWLAEDLGRHARVFLDEQLEEGVDWPLALAQALARSRVLVPLFSRLYFSSKWCCAELAHMRAREHLLGFRTPNNPAGLIVPAQIHDGDHIPPDARRLQALAMQPHANALMVKESLGHANLSEVVRGWSPRIAAAIDRAPPLQPGWLNLASADFVHAFETPVPTQSEPPTVMP